MYNKWSDAILIFLKSHILPPMVIAEISIVKVATLIKRYYKNENWQK